MGLTIELSFDMCKNTKITQTKDLLSNLAEKYNASSSYFIHEIEGHGTIIDRNDCIQITEFETNLENQSHDNILNYIKHIMRLKFIKFDCIYREKGEYKLIYASKKYLSIISYNQHSKSSVDYKPKSHNIIELVSNILT